MFYTSSYVQYNNYQNHAVNYANAAKIYQVLLSSIKSNPFVTRTFQVIIFDNLNTKSVSVFL